MLNSRTKHSVPIIFTPSATQEIKRLIGEQPVEGNSVLRVGVKGGGCSGISYLLDFDQLQEGDLTYHTDGISFVMNKNHQLYLQGMEIDWEDGLSNRGFTFINPNASKTCGCGSSFAV